MYAAEAKTLFPHACSGLTIELRMAILKGYYGKIFPRSGLLRDHFVTSDSWVVDADYRGTVVVLLINHSSEHYTIRVGDRIGQMIFMKKFDVNFEKIAEQDLLGKTNHDMGGFGSTGKYFLKNEPLILEEIVAIDD